MSMVTVTQVLTKVVSDREQDVINQLLVAALNQDAETIERMLTKSRTIKLLQRRGAVRVEGI